MNITPIEFDDQCTLVEWMERKGLKFTSIPNSTYIPGNKLVAAKIKRKNTASGLRKGFPDLVIIIPARLHKENKDELIFIEMKRKKGGVVSKHQKEWHDALIRANQKVFVCKGLDEAIEAIETLESFMK